MNEWGGNGRLSGAGPEVVPVTFSHLARLAFIPARSALRPGLACTTGLTSPQAGSRPAWGRSEAMNSNGGLLAPLPGECKGRLAGSHNAGADVPTGRPTAHESVRKRPDH